MYEALLDDRFSFNSEPLFMKSYDMLKCSIYKEVVIKFDFALYYVGGGEYSVGVVKQINLIVCLIGPRQEAVTDRNTLSR